MKRLSEETLLLIQQLYSERKSWIGRLFSRVPDYTSVIEKIVSSNEPAAITQIAALLFSSDKKTQFKLAEAIAVLLKNLPQQDYVSLDQQMRSSYYYYSLRIEPKDITKFRHLSSYRWVPLAIASVSGNGYAREKGCALLGATMAVEALPFLLLRANDWVDQVRAAAIKAISPYLSTDFADLLIDNLYLISRLEHSRSRDDGEVKKRTYSVLLEESSKNSLVTALSRPERFIKRTCYELGLRSPYSDMVEILRRGFSDADVIVRLSCCKRLQELPKDAVSLGLVQALVKDHFMPVKREALLILSRLDYSVTKQILHDNLCDRASSVRQMCRSLIECQQQDLPSDYFLQYYLDYLKSDDSKNAEGAIAGLAEIGNETHCQIIEGFLKHRYARVRRAAIKALSKLNSGGFTETFYQHLMTDSGSVAKEAAIAISISKSFISSEKLLNLFNQTENTNTKLIVLWLMNCSLDKWEKIIILLKTCVESNEEVFEKCTAYLGMWINNFNKGNTSTSTDNLILARRALSDVRDRLGSRFCKTLDFYLKEI